MAEDKDKVPADGDSGAPTLPTVDWDDSAMVSDYANVVNTAFTREEVSVFFGTNQTWKASEAKEVRVRLTHRIVLSPHAAKRLWLLLGAVIKAYENRFGSLGMDQLSDIASKATKQ